MIIGSARINLAKLRGELYRTAYTTKDFNEINKEAEQHIKILQEAADMLDNPEGQNKNSIGFKAIVKSKVSDKEYTAYFFMNHDGKTIGHTNLDLKKSFDSAMKDIEDYYNAKREVRSYLY